MRVLRPQPGVEFLAGHGASVFTWAGELHEH